MIIGSNIRLTSREMRLTIFQRMLIAPLVAITLYGAYLLVTYGEHRHAIHAIEEIRDESLPVMTLAGENIHLFESIVTQFKDAVLAGERDWLDSIAASRARIDSNFEQLKQYPRVVAPAELQRLSASFTQYYENAHALSLMLLDERKEATSEARNALIENVERYHNAVHNALTRLRDASEGSVRDTVTATNQRLNQLLILGVSIGALLLALVICLTVSLSMTTRRSLNEVIARMRDLAEGHPDFSKRLTATTHDEMGALVNWFNQLSDKLEDDYKKIEQLSITDKLTGLCNRAKIDQLFEHEIVRAQRYNEPLSVIMLDLDHFKQVNDQHGHQAGDRVLQKFAQILRNGVRKTDHVGRWGGEEFIVIAPSTSREQALILAEKLRERVEQQRFPDVGRKTASLGVATYAQGDDAASLTQRADEALYRAKTRGRNRAVSEEDTTVDTLLGAYPAP